MRFIHSYYYYYYYFFFHNDEYLLFLFLEYDIKSTEIISTIDSLQTQNNEIQINERIDNINSVEGRKNNVQYFLTKYEAESKQILDKKLNKYFFT